MISLPEKKTTCNNCTNHISHTILYGSHLIIGSSILSDSNYMHTQNKKTQNRKTQLCLGQRNKTRCRG